VSIQVQLGELADAVAVYRFAYLVTIAEDGRAHVVAVTPRWDGDALVVGGLGRRSVANLASRPAVTLVWPPLEPAGYSLILDGEAHSGDAAGGHAGAGEPAGVADPARAAQQAGVADQGGAAVTIIPSRAVLHRPAPGAASAAGTGAGKAAAPGADGCASDCVEVDLGNS
jgi:hypothetical protein